jgi:ankyrin repeat protein
MLALAACAILVAFAGCQSHRGGSTIVPLASDVTEFDNAVRDGDTDIVSRLIQAKPEMINAKDESGKTPLTIANEKGDAEMAKLLKRHGGHE